MPCKTVTVEEPVQDSSHLEIPNKPTLESNNPNEIVASWTVKNVVDSGSGEYLNGKVTVTIDGSVVDEHAVGLNPGNTDSQTRKYSNVAAGSGRELCVTVA